MVTIKECLNEIMGTQTVICQQIGYIRKEIQENKTAIKELRDIIKSELEDIDDEDE